MNNNKIIKLSISQSYCYTFYPNLLCATVSFQCAIPEGTTNSNIYWKCNLKYTLNLELAKPRLYNRVRHVKRHKFS